MLEQVILLNLNMDIEEEFRPLRTEEEAIIKKLLEVSFSGREELVEQLADLRAKQINSDGGLRFQVAVNKRAAIKRGVVVEARYADLDALNETAPHVNILLHVVDGMLSLLEVYKDDGSKILKKPNPNELQLFSRFNPEWKEGDKS